MTTGYYSPITYQVPPSEDGWLLKTILQKRMDVSRKLLSRLKMTEQGIMLNGERVYISVRVHAGDTVQIRMEQETSEDILPQPLPFEILYEDEHLLVVNKAAGMIVHPTHGHYTDTLANGVVYYWAQKGEQFRFRPVHRLDQETSGVLVIAKNPYSHQHISEQMIAGTVDKRYNAWVHGVPAALSGEIDGPIDRDPAEPHRRIVTPDGYPSLTRYEVKEVYPGAAKVELKLESGRTHQIRVHMGSIGCPLIGDGMYRHPLYSKAGLPAGERAQLERIAELDAGERAQPERIAELDAGEHAQLERIAELDASIPRQALHAVRLSFQHPVLRTELVFEAPLPPDLALLQAKLQREIAAVPAPGSDRNER
ncbi:RluA family pseudouridine synthase [Paenibacillus jilunlii]|uniref:Pseudouridine synthase n=1 Tax=Paenibacillus jilunlii TaxID=682956 RepID=A0A1G9Q0F7_9BACL|nr:RluA family pseudouridine synthase [Paenibacillus jilunlii]KWX73220.1 pseudouridine synthase [Paenibacillus jilunlii]SDM04552.1 23S rRNA pseudouridine1911/1915/1917 synthase [Paenibacillus jilunlii]